MNTVDKIMNLRDDKNFNELLIKYIKNTDDWQLFTEYAEFDYEIEGKDGQSEWLNNLLDYLLITDNEKVLSAYLDKYIDKTIIQDKYGKTFWHLAASDNNEKVLLKLFDYPEILEQVATIQNRRSKYTIWHLAATFCMEDTLLNLFKNQEILNKVATIQDIENSDTIWHIAAKQGKELESVLLNLFKYPEILKQVAAIQNDYGNTIWHESALNFGETVCKKAYKELPQIIKEIQDEEGQTFKDIAYDRNILLFDESLEDILSQRAKEVAKNSKLKDGKGGKE